MDIPYYYNSGYDDDGVDIYTCLQCGDKIYVRSWYEPNFCPYCGIKYKGKKENIGHEAKRHYTVCFEEVYYWAIEERTIEIWEEPATNPRWKEKGYYRYDPKQDTKKILAEKRKYEEENKADIQREIANLVRIQKLRRERDPNFNEEKAKTEKAATVKNEYRIVRKSETRRHSVLVRKDIYLQKTGKEFNEHKDRIPYGTKEEITTGIKFLPK